MSNRVLFPLIAFGLIFFMGLYFLINPSYQRSVQAKYYYEIGEYKEAHVLAKEAFGLDVYNRMASTVMAQSITALKYTKYIEDAKAYMLQINEIATHESISKSDKAKIKLICEIMVDSYAKLAPSVITDAGLIQETKEQYEKFEKLLEKVNQ